MGSIPGLERSPGSWIAWQSTPVFLPPPHNRFQTILESYSNQNSMTLS